ncbi:hypothetical protein GCM10007170_46640 [Arthrobacter liuii]|uniref:Uncharacterized protein n=1 Tax=Arthrobacter liuii TaxID=1476996 RepID=A0ABQ2AZR8_9MICC|nr:hypothetical protein GCM10007170_46640 [Arthrobacter liuii]
MLGWVGAYALQRPGVDWLDVREQEAQHRQRADSMWDQAGNHRPDGRDRDQDSQKHPSLMSRTHRARRPRRAAKKDRSQESSDRTGTQTGKVGESATVEGK